MSDPALTKGASLEEKIFYPHNCPKVAYFFWSPSPHVERKQCGKWVSRNASFAALAYIGQSHRQKCLGARSTAWCCCRLSRGVSSVAKMSARAARGPSFARGSAPRGLRRAAFDLPLVTVLHINATVHSFFFRLGQPHVGISQ